jgi:hypothetical protein
LDNVLQSGTKSGYNFSIIVGTGTPATTYTSSGDPVVPGTSGQRHFFSDATGVIRSNGSAVAAATDTPIQ